MALLTGGIKPNRKPANVRGAEKKFPLKGECIQKYALYYATIKTEKGEIDSKIRLQHSQLQ